jgi:hypothetical protein
MTMGQFVDQKIYRTFEEFEREELRRDGYFESVDTMIDEMFAGELDFGGESGGSGRRGRGAADDEEE